MLNVDFLCRGAVIVGMAVVVAIGLGVAYMLATLWPAQAPLLIGTHVACVLGPGLLLRDKVRKRTSEVCDWLGDEVESRKLADQRDDVNFVRMQRAQARRQAEVLPPIPMVAGPRRARREIVVPAQRHDRG